MERFGDLVEAESVRGIGHARVATSDRVRRHKEHDLVTPLHGLLDHHLPVDPGLEPLDVEPHFVPPSLEILLQDASVLVVVTPVAEEDPERSRRASHESRQSLRAL